MLPRLVPEMSPLDAFCDGVGVGAAGVGIGDSRSLIYIYILRGRTTGLTFVYYKLVS